MGNEERNDDDRRRHPTDERPSRAENANSDDSEGEEDFNKLGD